MFSTLPNAQPLSEKTLAAEVDKQEAARGKV